MITGGKEELTEITKTHQCPEHGRKLTVAWHAGENSYVIRCSEGHFPEEVTRELTPIEEHKAGERASHGALTSLLPRTDLQTGELLTPDTIAGMISYAVKYGLDPWRGHIVLMWGKPYITIDGYLYKARKSEIPYTLESRPLNEAERTEWGLPTEDIAWRAEVKLFAPDRVFIGHGIVAKEEREELAKGKPSQKRYPVVAAKPWQMAQKRAEWQALRRAFPIGETEEIKEEV